MSDGDPDKTPDDIHAAEYVLGLLSADDRTAFATRLDAEPELHQKLIFWETHFGVLNDEIAETQPPAHLYEKIEGRLFGSPKAVRSNGFLSWVWQNTGFWRTLSAVSLIAVLIISAQNLSLIGERKDAATLSYVGQLADAEGPYKVATLFEPASGILKLNREAGPIKAGRSLELWLIEEGQPPLSLGLLPATNKGTLLIPADLRGKMPTALLAITDEPLGGGPEGKPTGAVVASGKLSAL